MPTDQPAPHLPPAPLPRPALNRRHVLALSATAATVAATGVQLATPGSALAGGGHDRPRPGRVVDRHLEAPVERAYHYLDVVQDAYQRGDTPRLLQSYNNESQLMTTAFIYDNALAAIAYLARPTRDNVRRARIIGDALLFTQDNDEAYADGRLRQAYAAGPMLFYGGSPDFPGLVRADGKAAFLWPYGFSGSSVGDVSWAALALTHLYAHTRVRKYLDGAVAAASWVVDNTVSPYRYGGYHGGVQGDGVTHQRWCSTEHNIDAYALFTLLARYTGDRAWHRHARVAGDFVRGMWNPVDGHFWTGTQGAGPDDDPDQINRAVRPEDPNTWGYLALREQKHARGLDWTARELAVTDAAGPDSEMPPGRPVSGVTFSDLSKVLTGTVPGGDRPNNRNAVWLEGNGHLAAALLERGDRPRRGPDDRTRAVHYLRQAVVAQEVLGGGQTVGLTADPNGGRLSDPAAGGTWTGRPLPARSGIVSATSAFDTGFGFAYFQRQHVGATAWFLMGAQSVNPYRI
ncbi:hypothetical protein AB0I61_18345 [Polymorphospora rubra]|uniref:hypothetical protein n=1 Tax=Polymorphospora rubra TaxID=338584 RepID=UPI0033C7C8CC